MGHGQVAVPSIGLAGNASNESARRVWERGSISPGYRVYFGWDGRCW
jgi:hypothetical protein